MECLNLITANSLIEKRIGYLGTNIILTQALLNYSTKNQNFSWWLQTGSESIWPAQITALLDWCFALSVRSVQLNLPENFITKYWSAFLTTALILERKPSSLPSESLKNVLSIFLNFWRKSSIHLIKKIMESFSAQWLSLKTLSILMKTLWRILSTQSLSWEKFIEWSLNNTILSTKLEVFKIRSFKSPFLNSFDSWKNIQTRLIKIS